MKNSWSILLLGAVAACGTPKTPEAPAPPPASASAEPAPQPSASASSDDVASAPPPAADAGATEATEPKPSDEGPREVRFVFTAGKLEVKIEGVRFRPVAKAVKVGGGWGLELNADAEAEDGKSHSLLASKVGVFAFGGKVTRKGKTESFGDQREGEEEIVVSRDAPQKLVRKWPAKGEKPLASGDKLELEVGLWGIGADKDSRRPVKKFALITMSVGKGEPKALLAPPE